MFYENRSKDDLIKELARLQQRITELEDKETVHERAEEQVRKEMEFTMKMIHTSPTLFITLAPDFKMMLMNETAMRTLGYRSQEVVGCDFVKKFVLPENQTLVSQMLGELKAEHKPTTTEFSLLTKTGTPVLTEWYCNAVVKEGDQVDYILGVGIDITERKQIEEALRESEEKFRTLAEESPNMIFINKAEKIVYANKLSEEIMGYTRSEFCNPDFDFMTLIAPEYRHLVKNALTKHMQGQEVAPYEYALVTKKGARIEAIITTKLIEYAGHKAILGIITDITARKEYEKKLTESEGKYRQLVEQSLQGLIIMHDFRIVFTNKAFTEISRYTTDELLGLPPEKIKALVHPDYQQTVWGRFKERIAGKEATQRYEFVGVRKDGSHCWLEMFASPIQYLGKPAVQAVIVDITERKQAELSLAQEREKFSTIFNCASDAIFIHDFNDKFLEVNKTAYERLGYTRDELLTMKAMDIDSEYAQITPQRMKELEQKGQTFFETAHITKEGKEIIVELNSRIINYEGMPAVLSIARDISERKLMEQHLQASEKKYRDLVDNALVGVYKSTLDGAFLYANDALAAMFEYDTPDEMLKDGALRLYRHLDDRKKFIQTIKEKGRVSYFEMELMTKSGHPRHVLVSAILDGEVLSGMIMDITKRKSMEEELKNNMVRLQEIMENTVHSMARILETRDPYTAGHQKRVAQLAMAIAGKMNLSENQVRGLHMAAIIHDIGKIYIPAEILTRPSTLTESEFALIKTHPQVGHDILKKVEFPWPVAVIVLQHHERFNGTGYPQGLKEKNIILEARILAVADVVEAMSSHRPYRPAISMEETMSEITKNKGRLYDPIIADVCCCLFADDGFTFTSPAH